MEESPSRVLCSDRLTVLLSGGDGRPTLEIRDGEAAAFCCEFEDLEDALHGVSLQLMAEDGFCTIDVAEGQVRLHFSMSGKPRNQCAFPADSVFRRETLSADSLNRPSPTRG